MLYEWLWILVLLILVCFLIGKTRLGKRRRKNGNNVVSLNYAKKTAGAQPCSYCRKKSEKLTFYFDGNKVAGVCPQCKPKAQQRDLTPI
jgi:hypothetical protein